MAQKNTKILTPSEFYRARRPELFSDSEIISESLLSKELLALELSKITTNQKQDEFETLCRRLSEKLISPNLIPQTGPTGGGDGKTDTETYPVSTTISDRWFIPEEGWTNDEKWAFAFSAKHEWKSKAKADIKKIVDTERGYTKVYFITNQTPSSKKKKAAQDEFTNSFDIEVIILDGKWILENVFTNNLIHIAVSSLNLSDIYKNTNIKLGPNDTERLNQLEDLEKSINNPKRYSEYDFQLVEDCIEAAIISRMLEKPRDEVEGKFNRAFRICEKVNNEKQWLRLHYQKAWTYINWYDDYSSFTQEFKNFKKYISKTSSISDVELYVTLFHLLTSIESLGKRKLSDFQINLENEKSDLDDILSKFEKDTDRPSSALIAKTYKTILKLIDALISDVAPERYIKKLSVLISSSSGFLNYPFESFQIMIESLGAVLSNNKEFDALIDHIAIIAEKRNSELAAGHIFLKRGDQKLIADLFEESVIYYGKAVLKLAKEESNVGLYHTMINLAKAYSGLNLYWASNNCLVAASGISITSWHESGKISKGNYDCAMQLAFNELLIGRVPSFLCWHEMFMVFSSQIDVAIGKDAIPPIDLMDGLLSVRILNDDIEDGVLSILPDILSNQELWQSADSALYKLGYTEQLIEDYNSLGITDIKGLDNYFKLIANHPFKKQMLNNSDIMSGDTITISTQILGCHFIIKLEKDVELLLVGETLLAFFESFFSTSLRDVYPSTESIIIVLIKNENEKIFSFENTDSSFEYIIKVNDFNFSDDSRQTVWEHLLKFTGHILATNFIMKESKQYLENLIKKEEVYERLSLVIEHRKFSINTLGMPLKYFINDWIEINTHKEYQMKRAIPLSFDIPSEDNTFEQIKKDKSIVDGHNKRTVFSVIDKVLWDKAKWKGLGVIADTKTLGLALIFEDIETGKTIFGNWVKKFGKEDKNDSIRLVIIRGIDKHNPFSYKVLIGSNIKIGSLNPQSLILFTTRYCEMVPTNSLNMDLLINTFESGKQYTLGPVLLSQNSVDMDTYLANSILKTNLIIRNAWEIGKNDLDGIAITESDTPVIPDDVIDAPVLELLKRKLK